MSQTLNCLNFIRSRRSRFILSQILIEIGQTQSNNDLDFNGQHFKWFSSPPPRWQRPRPQPLTSYPGSATVLPQWTLQDK